VAVTTSWPGTCSPLKLAMPCTASNGAPSVVDRLAAMAETDPPPVAVVRVSV
jgi:hypothetical protein